MVINTNRCFMIETVLALLFKRGFGENRDLQSIHCIQQMSVVTSSDPTLPPSLLG